MIVRNPAIRGVHLLRYFLDSSTLADKSSGFAGDVYRPLTTLSFALDFKAWGLRPGFYHAEDILLHLAGGYLFWRLLRSWLKNETEALLGAAVFLLHPVQVEAAAWLAQRTNLLSTVALLGALHCVCAERGKYFRNWILGAVCYSVALLCREAAIVLPALVVLIDVQGWLPKLRGRAERAPLYGGLTLLSAGYLALRFHFLGHWSQFSEAVPPWWQSSGLGVLAFSTYLGKTLWPVALRPSYDYPDFHLWLLTGAYGVALAYLAVLWETRKRAPLLFTGLAWFLAGLLPVLQLVPIRAYVSERFLYVPMMGAALAAVWAYRTFRAARAPLWGAVAVMAVLSAAAAPHWHDEASLWSHAVAAEPGNAFAHACLAGALKDPVEREKQYKLALADRPNDAVRLASTNNLASVYLDLREPAKAAIWARAALRLQPHAVPALFNLCRASSALGRKADAAAACGELKRLSPPGSRGDF